MKRALTAREKRTVRIAAIGLACYLALFYGLAFWNYLMTQRAQYDALVQEANGLRDVIQPYRDKIAAVTSLMDRFRMDPIKLKRSTVLAEASAAVQHAAGAEGVELGPVRELPGRAAAKEAGSIQFEATGPIPAVLAFLHNLGRGGFPVVIDTIQMSPDSGRPNGIKATLTMVVLDFDAWRTKEEKPNA